MAASLDQQIVKDVIRDGEVLQYVDAQVVVRVGMTIEGTGELLLVGDASLVMPDG